MIKNYLKVAWRNLARNKSYTALNIAGLATGMAVALLIAFWVYQEYSYDRFLPDHSRLYEVRLNYYGNGDTVDFAASSLKLADALRSQVPEMEAVAETDYFGSHGLAVGEKKLFLNGGQTAPAFISMFGFPMVSGDPVNALKNTYSIVLTESTAKALFGTADPINKTVRIDNKNNLTVTGVMKDLPANSTVQFQYLVPFSYYEATDEMTGVARNRNFQWNGYQAFVKLRPGVSLAAVLAKIRDIEKVDKDNIMSVKTDVVLQPMDHWHLYEKYENGHEAGGLIDYVKIFSLIGVLVLLIACVNFVNLSTARSEKRSREVGVRKVLGSQKNQLVFQFLTESFLVTLIAFVCTLVLLQLALPLFNSLTGSGVTIPWTNVFFWLIALGAVVMTALASGTRPAFYLSSFNPVRVLRSSVRAGRAATLPRKVLVVLQFSCSIALIIGTAIIYQQINHAKNRPAGFTTERLMMTDMSEDLSQHYAALRDAMIQKGIATQVTTATSAATNTGGHRDVEGWPGKRENEVVNMGRITVSENYFQTLGMAMKEGRSFDSRSDTMNVVINEAAAKLMRLDKPLDQVITYFDDKFTIVGVVKDALTVSPFSSPDPTIFFYNEKPQGVMMYRLAPGVKTQDAIASLSALFAHYNPEFPYVYQFADQRYAAKFSQEMLIGKLAALFAGLAIFISCLGLFGLAAYTAEQRTKEIGIRKVLGASVARLWLMLSSEFVTLVLISCVIASPIARYFAQGWLEKYTYRIQIGNGIFVLAAFVVVFITLATISVQAIRAALANPVKSLRS